MGKGGGKGKASVISGSQHFIISKQIVWTVILVAAGTFVGMYLSEHLRAKQTEEFLRHKNNGVGPAAATTTAAEPPARLGSRRRRQDCPTPLPSAPPSMLPNRWLAF